MTLTLPVGSFTCKKCEVTFNGEYKPQQRPRKSCPKCHKMVGMTVSVKKNKRQEKVIPPPQPPSQDFIDAPDELLMDLSMNVLNRQRYDLLKNGTIPTNQWASILISVRKENIGKSKKEGNLQSQFKSMTVADIAKIISQKPKSTSQEQDLKESS